eukprot:2374959-Amphidinium_carterae.1
MACDVLPWVGWPSGKINSSLTHNEATGTSTFPTSSGVLSRLLYAQCGASPGLLSARQLAQTAESCGSPNSPASRTGHNHMSS